MKTTAKHRTTAKKTLPSGLAVGLLNLTADGLFDILDDLDDALTLLKEHRDEFVALCLVLPVQDPRRHALRELLRTLNAFLKEKEDDTK